jgi:hypothetical protein
MRAPNEIDFWRGLALVTIFIDHVPGIVFENYTWRNIAISDAAEVFVFLAGWSVRLVVASKRKPQGALRIFARFEDRALTIYIAQIFIVSIALAMTAAGALLFRDPLILDWNNASAIFETPVEAQSGVVLLSHQLGYFDILPLYVLLMMITPFMILIDRLSGWLLLALSLGIYIPTLWFGVNIPTWPVEGRWFFNPLAWQLVFVLGFLCAAPDGIAAFAHRRRNALRWLVFPGLVYAGWLASSRWTPDPLMVPEPALFFMFDKTYASPARVVHLLGAVVFISGLFVYILRWARPAARFASMLGRNSLNVFCAASVLSLASQFGRYALGNSFFVDCCVLVVGIVAMGMTAWLSEWSDRIA